MGHPTHIFDYDKIPSNNISVRRVKNDKTITTLDEEKRKLSKQQLLITDGKKPIALAGIMGGLESAVQDNTTTVFVESAYFDPVAIRKGSKELGLLTEASRRFERGADIHAAETALWRVINLVQEIAGGELVPPFECFDAVSQGTAQMSHGVSYYWINNNFRDLIIF